MTPRVGARLTRNVGVIGGSVGAIAGALVPLFRLEMGAVLGLAVVWGLSHFFGKRHSAIGLLMLVLGIAFLLGLSFLFIVSIRVFGITHAGFVAIFGAILIAAFLALMSIAGRYSEARKVAK